MDWTIFLNHEFIYGLDKLFLEVQVDLTESTIDMLFKNRTPWLFFPELVNHSRFDNFADSVLDNSKLGGVHELIQENLFFLVDLV